MLTISIRLSKEVRWGLMVQKVTSSSSSMVVQINCDP